MFRVTRLFLVLIFSLATVLAGGPRVHAMSAAAGLTAIVICAENGAKTIYLNAEGAPAQPTSDCADCPICIALSAPALLAPEHSAPVRAARRSGGCRFSATVARTRPNLRPQSRGPPPRALSNACPARANPAPMRIRTAVRASTKADLVASGMCHRSGRYFKDARG
ncbi:DUF2946 family protein [Albidovulum sediminicola]|uniref:DUF2946 family protein n=1 Tax=Albidovulum sediminicola TaxID=2984331 RepID=UPI003991A451